MSILANGDVIKLGTLYMGATKVTRPTVPWQTGSETYTGSGAGNIAAFVAGANLVIQNTSATDIDKMQWVEVNEGGKKYLVCDRVMLTSISWDDLNAQSLIFGKNITIDGQLYKIRALTAGSNYRSGTDAYSGGTPTTNEWDKWITNESALVGLPTPIASDLDSTRNATDKNGVHNQKWNWLGVYSWGQETYTGNSSNRALRGFNSARLWVSFTSSYRFSDIGWRPVLEVLNSAPVISGTDENLGSQPTPLQKTYSATDAEGDVFSLVEKIDGTTIRTVNPATGGANYIFDATDAWSSLTLGTHTATVTATDSQGASNTRTWTFSKTNQAPAAPLLDFPLTGMRTSVNPLILFRAQNDAEGDTQTFKLQIADNAAFTTNLIEVTNGFEINRGSGWEPFTTLSNADVGLPCRVQVNGLVLYTSKYLRIGSVDSGSLATSYSDPQLFKVGNELEVLSEKFPLDFRPNKLNVIDIKQISPSVEQFKVYVTNNANDVTPTWEDATESYLNGQAYPFTNYEKTASNWAVQVKYYVKAGLATSEISISSHGGGII